MQHQKFPHEVISIQICPHSNKSIKIRRCGQADSHLTNLLLPPIEKSSLKKSTQPYSTPLFLLFTSKLLMMTLSLKPPSDSQELPFTQNSISHFFTFFSYTENSLIGFHHPEKITVRFRHHWDENPTRIELYQHRRGSVNILVFKTFYWGEKKNSVLTYKPHIFRTKFLNYCSAVLIQAGFLGCCFFPPNIDF